MRSGFVTLVGRPNVGKSTLVNAICGQKISIVSDKPQTTRRQIRGILTRPEVQIVFVDTPGLHKPVTALGTRVNAAAIESIQDVDVSCLVIDATKEFGSGDRWVAQRLDMSKTLSDRESVQMQLGRVAMAIDTGRLLTMRAAWRLEQGKKARPEISMAKIQVADTLHLAADTAIQLCGARGSTPAW